MKKEFEKESGTLSNEIEKLKAGENRGTQPESE